jgi:uroporphyrin-3 C-methyltransferase
MSADTMDTAPALPAPTESSMPRTPRPRSGGSAAAILIALLALVLAGYAAWRSREIDAARSSAEQQTLAAQVEALTHSVEQLRGNADAVRARLEDNAKVDQTERTEVIGLGERARLLEDAVANLADKRLSGRDALVLDEAELLLTLGAERYTLFHDANAAIAAYRMADTALGEVENAAFATVRQSVAAEIDAFGAQRGADTNALLAQLAQLAAQLPDLPVPARTPAPETSADTSRLWRVLGALVQVRHGDDANLLLHDASLSRTLAVLDLHEAESAALARDNARYHARLAEARAQLGAFDRHEPHVASAYAALDQLDRAELAPAPPALLGAALKELRNLRATHALRNLAPRGAPPPAAAPPTASPAKADEAHP